MPSSLCQYPTTCENPTKTTQTPQNLHPPFVRSLRTMLQNSFISSRFHSTTQDSTSTLGIPSGRNSETKFVASVYFIAVDQPRLSTLGKFRAYALQNDTSLLQGHNRQQPQSHTDQEGDEIGVESPETMQQRCRDGDLCYNIGERASNNTRPQTKYARPQRYPVNTVTTTNLGTFQ